MAFLFSFLSGIISIYTLLCFIDIALSWFPGGKYTSFGKVISKICDPYLNFFSRRGFFRIGNLDFSPVISIGILSLASSILAGISSTGIISFHAILSSIISMVWSLISSVLTVFFILILVRWIVLKVHHGQTEMNSGWYKIDVMIQHFCYRVSNSFVKKSHSYMTSLLVNWIVLLVILIAGNIVFRWLASLCYSIPF